MEQLGGWSIRLLPTISDIYTQRVADNRPCCARTSTDLRSLAEPVEAISVLTRCYLRCEVRQTHAHDADKQAITWWREIDAVLLFSVRLRSSYARYCDRRLSVCPSVCLSNAWIVTKRKHLAKKIQL